MEIIGTGIGFYLAPIVIMGCLTVLAVVIGGIASLFGGKK